VEDGGVDARAIGRRGERAGRVTKEGEDRERVPTERDACPVGIEDPDIGPADARRGEPRVEGDVLAAVGGGDEGAALARAGEDDVARLVTDEQGPYHGAVGVPVVEPHDAHAVGQMVDDPYLFIAPGGDRDRLEADGNRHARHEARGLDLEDLEAVVGGIDGVEEPAAG
jgi:hypothetical protein